MPTTTLNIPRLYTKDSDNLLIDILNRNEPLNHNHVALIYMEGAGLANFLSKRGFTKESQQVRELVRNSLCYFKTGAGHGGL